MKQRHWFVWYVFMVALTCKMMADGIPKGLTLSQLDWSNLIAFTLGTIGTAIACACIMD